MPKIDDFYINFDKQFSVYEPGDVVSGSVHIALNDAFVCNRIVLQFFGSARIYWIERGVRDNVYQAITYHQEKVYYDDKASLWEFQPSSQQAVEGAKPSRGTLATQATAQPHLTKGNHTFQFSFQLPDELPTSFEASGAYGNIRHWVKVLLMIGEASKATRKCGFSVVQPVDLGKLGRGVQFGQSQHFESAIIPSGFCLMRGTGHIEATVSMPKSGFVPGEQVRLSVEVINHSKRNVKRVRMALCQIVTTYVFKPEFSQKESFQDVTALMKDTKELSRSGAGAQQLQINEQVLVVPAVVPGFCEPELMECRYVLMVELLGSSKYPLLRAQLPVVIGTIPIQAGAYKDDLRQRFSSHLNHNLPLYDSVVDEDNHLFAPPPSYEESVMGRTPGAGNDDLDLPRYAYYNFGSIQ